MSLLQHHAVRAVDRLAEDGDITVCSARKGMTEMATCQGAFQIERVGMDRLDWKFCHAAELIGQQNFILLAGRVVSI